MEDRLRELKRCVGRGNSGFAARDMSERHWQHLKSCTCDDDPYGEACGFCLCERGNSGFYSDKEILEHLNTRATDPLLEKMAEALEELDDMFDPTSRVGEIINKALQEYRERKDATTSN